MQYAFLRGGGDFGINPWPNINIFYQFHHLVPFYKSLLYLKKKKEIPGAKIKNIGKLQYMWKFSVSSTNSRMVPY